MLVLRIEHDYDDSLESERLSRLLAMFEVGARSQYQCLSQMGDGGFTLME